MDNAYYREKIISLSEKLFIETGDARSRIINCEDKIESAYFASQATTVPKEIQKTWEKIYKELNKKEAYYDNKGRLMSSSLSRTVKSRHNKTMEKYLLFFLEEFYQVL